MQLVVLERALLHLAVRVRDLALPVQHVLFEATFGDDAARVHDLGLSVEQPFAELALSELVVADDATVSIEHLVAVLHDHLAHSDLVFLRHRVLYLVL